MITAEKLQDFCIAMHYEDLILEAYDAINELCHIAIYDGSDDNFDDYDYFDEE